MTVSGLEFAWRSLIGVLVQFVNFGIRVQFGYWMNSDDVIAYAERARRGIDITVVMTNLEGCAAWKDVEEAVVDDENARIYRGSLDLLRVAMSMVIRCDAGLKCQYFL